MLSQPLRHPSDRVVPVSVERTLKSALGRATGLFMLVVVALLWISIASWSVVDPSLTHATSGETRNLLGALGAIVSDLLLQAFGLATIVLLAAPMFWGLEMAFAERLARLKSKLLLYPFALLLLAGAVSALPVAERWPLHHGYGGIMGDAVYSLVTSLTALIAGERAGAMSGLALCIGGFALLSQTLGVALQDLLAAGRGPTSAGLMTSPLVQAAREAAQAGAARIEPAFAADTPLGRAVSAARHSATRGLAAVQAGARGMRESLAADPHFKAAHHRYGAGDPGPAYEHEARQTLHPANPFHAADGAGSPLGAAPPPYLPPHPPAAMPPRAPSRGPAAMAPVAGHEADHHFDEATDRASRAIAARFAPAGVAPQPEAAVPPRQQATWLRRPMAPPLQAHAAPLGEAPRAVLHEPLLSAPAPLPPAPPSVRAGSPPVASGTTAEVAPVPQKRNALFGGLTFRRQAEPAFKLPPVGLLKRSAPNRAGPEFTQTVLRGNARLLEDVLADFGVKGEVKEIRPGPVVTLFELEPARGTKSSRVIGLADDIARSMSATAVRVAVVPGRNAIGIELPNVRRDGVLLRDLLESDAFRNCDATLPVALGKGIGGEPVVADLARMPHLLVAGTTGSGKSVGVNAMIASLLYRLTPEECRFLMIDPKMLELSVYNGIPHLLAPVVTDPGKAVAALNWVVGEMEERYKRMAKLAVRNIDVYNNRVRNAKKRGEMIARTVQTGFDRATGEAVYEQEALDLAPMPYIVVVIDEFADLMLVAGKEVEAAVQRLAQMARAAGIHIIMATQRPSVDVITGTIKANFPTRISFKVASKIDSRTILNEQGAEQLLGQGDMLYASGSGQVLRVHGAFVADEEVEAVARHLREQGAPDYVLGITEPADPAREDGSEPPGHGEEDLFDRAVAIVLRDRKASTSYIQRRLSIGYNRAADLVERMEREGLIGPANSVGKREILAGVAGDLGSAPGGTRDAA